MHLIKRFRVIVMLAITVIVLSSCATSNVGYGNREYLKHAQTIPPLKVPASASAPKEQPYYPLPKLAYVKETQPVSLVPPGSKILQYRTQGKKTVASKADKTSWAKMKNGSRALVLSAGDVQKAWTKVGRALRKTPYQILDEDSGLKTYYVLDIKSTDDKITSNTPIYRVQVHAMGKNAEVSILNQYNKPAEPQVAARILQAVQTHLS